MFSDVLNRHANERCKWKNTQSRQQKEQKRWNRKPGQQRGRNRKDEQDKEPSRHGVSSSFYETLVAILPQQYTFPADCRSKSEIRTSAHWGPSTPGSTNEEAEKKKAFFTCNVFQAHSEPHYRITSQLEVDQQKCV